MGKGFELGSPFSPEILSLVGRERERRDRRSDRVSDDQFRRAQMSIGVQESNRSHRLRTQMLNLANQRDNAKSEVAREQADRAFNEAQRRFDLEQETASGLREESRLERDRQFTHKTDVFQEAQRAAGVREEETGRHNIATEDVAVVSAATAAQRADEYARRTDVMELRETGGIAPEGELPSVDPENLAPGSLQGQRAARGASSNAQAKLAEARAEQIVLRNEGKYPPSYSEEQKALLGWANHALAVEAQGLRTTEASIRLALKMMDTLKDQFTGDFNLENRKAMDVIAASIAGIFEDGDLHQAFVKAYQKSAAEMIQQYNQEIREGERSGVGGPAQNPGPQPEDLQGDGSLGDQGDAIERRRRQAVPPGGGR